MQIRDAGADDHRAIWALNAIPHIGATADPHAPLDLAVPDGPPDQFPDLADVEQHFAAFLVVEDDGRIVAMGGIKPSGEVNRVRVHPARRRESLGRTVMTALEDRARELGMTELHLDTADNQPEAIAFYNDLGYTETGRESRPEWVWTLVYFRKGL